MNNLIYTRMMATYRATLNPLRGLTIQRVVTLLEEGERGAYADLQWLYRFIEKRDATLRGVKRRLRSALTKLDWDIRVVENVPAGQEAIAERQRDTLRTTYDRIENLREALAALSLAEFRGYSHLEKVPAADGDAITRLEPVPQWHWCRDGLYGDWTFNADSASGRTRGEAVDLSRFVVREVDDPINEIALIAFVRKALSQKDWDGFVENYGIPFVFLILGQQAGAADPDEYQAIVNQIASDSRGVLPHGSDIKTADSGNRGTNPFAEHLDYQDKQIVLAGTSGLLTMLSEPTGIGEGASGAHQDTFDEVALAQAMDISEILQAQIDRPILAARHPGEPVYAYFELAARDADDVTTLFDNAVKAAQAGLALDADELAEKTGLKITRAAQPRVGGVPGATGTDPEFAGPGLLTNREADPAFAGNDPATRPDGWDDYIAEGEAAIGGALADAHADWIADLAAARDIEDPAARRAALEDLRNRLPEEFTRGLRRLLPVWEAYTGTAAAEGILRSRVRGTRSTADANPENLPSEAV